MSSIWSAGQPSVISLFVIEEASISVGGTSVLPPSFVAGDWGIFSSASWAMVYHAIMTLFRSGEEQDRRIETVVLLPCEAQNHFMIVPASTSLIKGTYKRIYNKSFYLAGDVRGLLCSYIKS